MKITKRQLRRIIREEKAKIIAEEKVRKIVREKLAEAYGAKGPARGKSNLLEFFGLFGGADDEKVKKLNRMVQGIAEMAQDVKNYVASGNNEKAANSRDGIVDTRTIKARRLRVTSRLSALFSPATQGRMLYPKLGMRLKRLSRRCE